MKMRCMCILLSAYMLLFAGCARDYDEVYSEAIAAVVNGEYNVALSLMDSLHEHEDPRNIRKQAETGLLRLEAGYALQNGRYESVIRLLDTLPNFPQSDEMRIEAEAGIYRERIINDITNALSYGNYEYVLATLDENPQFEDDMRFRQRALRGIEVRESDERLAHFQELATFNKRIAEAFQMVSLTIESRNKDVIEVVPGGFVNPGTISVIVEFDSIVRFGVANPNSIAMRRVNDVLFVDASSIQIEVMESIVKNYEQIDRFRSNPLVSFTAAVLDQIFEAQVAHEQRMIQRLGTEQNIETARRSFMNSFEAFCLGMGLSVVWEN